MLVRICYHCGKHFYGAVVPFKFCPNCKKPWHEKSFVQEITDKMKIPRKVNEYLPKTLIGGDPMAKKLFGAAAKAHAAKAARGGKPKKAAKKAAKAAAKKGARTIQHKAYTYTNKKGKRVTVAAHAEHIK